MPHIQKTCLLCGGWIKRGLRKRNSLCLRCIEKVNRDFQKWRDPTKVFDENLRYGDYLERKERD